MKTKLFSGIYLVWMFIFIIIPLLFIAYFAFTDDAGTFSLDAWRGLTSFTPTILDSLRLALYATVICLLLGYPVAYIISRSSLKVQSAMMMLIMLPMWMNFLLRIYGLMNILETNGLINNFLEAVGISRLQLINTDGAVILGMVYEFLPFMILPLYSVMSKIDISLIEAASDLGCNSSKTLMKVILPLSVPGIVSGITMVFVPAASTFVISQKLGGTKPLIGEFIEEFFMMDMNYSVGSALSLILMIAILICMGITNHFSDSEDGPALI